MNYDRYYRFENIFFAKRKWASYASASLLHDNFQVSTRGGQEGCWMGKGVPYFATVSGRLPTAQAAYPSLVKVKCLGLSHVGGVANIRRCRSQRPIDRVLSAG
ncbi:MAG: hypothetical protein KatS3mg105_0907 [Gemmatales bacterium]|nr:MAG: hypothetical protein KatS3mg105_0907 [Gemmatales bacterium]